MRQRPPLLPRKPSDPTGTSRLEARASKEIGQRMSKVLARYKQAIELFGPRPLQANRDYTYELDASRLSWILEHAADYVDEVLLEGGPMDLWLLEGYVEPAYQRGTSQQWSNLSNQSSVYRASNERLADLLISDPYRRRVALLGSRVFEEMKGLSASTKLDMARILSSGMLRGLGPRDIAAEMTAKMAMDARRAATIARTEINTALRRARLDEADEAEETYSLKSMEMHFSALSPTTRVEHAERHGKLFTTDEQRAWWAKDANSINCKCTTVTVMVDEDLKPLVPGVVERAQKIKRKAIQEQDQ